MATVPISGAITIVCVAITTAVRHFLFTRFLKMPLLSLFSEKKTFLLIRTKVGVGAWSSLAQGAERRHPLASSFFELLLPSGRSLARFFIDELYFGKSLMKKKRIVEKRARNEKLAGQG